MIDLTVPGQRVAGSPKRYEVVDGLIVAKRYLDARTGWIRSRLMSRMYQTQADERSGTLVYSALFRLHSTRTMRRPDLAFISAERWPVHKLPPAAEAWDVIPDLVVELVHPRGRVFDLMSRVEDYFEAGVRFVWIFCPKFYTAYVYHSPKIVQILDRGDVLDGSAIFPGLWMPLSEVFETEADEPPADPA